MPSRRRPPMERRRASDRSSARSAVRSARFPDKGRPDSQHVALVRDVAQFAEDGKRPIEGALGSLDPSGRLVQDSQVSEGDGLGAPVSDLAIDRKTPARRCARHARSARFPGTGWPDSERDSLGRPVAGPAVKDQRPVVGAFRLRGPPRMVVEKPPGAPARSLRNARRPPCDEWRARASEAVPQSGAGLPFRPLRPPGQRFSLFDSRGDVCKAPPRGAAGVETELLSRVLAARRR